MESATFSLMDNVLEYREIGLHMAAYEAAGNYPGIVKEAIRLLWETIWIQNVYYQQ